MEHGNQRAHPDLMRKPCKDIIESIELVYDSQIINRKEKSLCENLVKVLFRSETKLMVVRVSSPPASCRSTRSATSKMLSVICDQTLLLLLEPCVQNC